MSETKEELISFIQQLIDNKSKDNMKCSAINLCGSIGQHKRFKEWLKNNYKSNNDLKQLILKFIYENSIHFCYDFKTGFILNNNYINFDRNSVLIKPKILIDLEMNYYLQSFDDNLFVFELILFIINEISNKTIIISKLIQLIEEKCEKQLNCFKSMIGLNEKNNKNNKSLDKCEIDLNLINEKVLIDLISKLNPFISFELSQKSLSINRSQELSEIFDCLTKSCFKLINNSLKTHLYSFGKKCLKELNQKWLKNDYKIIYEFLVQQRHQSLDQIIDFYGNELIVERIDSTNPLIDLNLEVINKRRFQELQLWYKKGDQMRGMSGMVSEIGVKKAIIKVDLKCISQSELDLDLSESQFIVCPQLVQIYGQEVLDLKAFLHFGDRLSFDVKFFSSFEYFLQKSKQNPLKDLWFVTTISSVKHFGSCFVDSFVNRRNEWKDDSGSDDNSE